MLQLATGMSPSPVKALQSVHAARLEPVPGRDELLLHFALPVLEDPKRARAPHHLLCAPTSDGRVMRGSTWYGAPPFLTTFFLSDLGGTVDESPVAYPVTSAADFSL
jgi:hypothetical protein